MPLQAHATARGAQLERVDQLHACMSSSSSMEL